MSRFARSWPRLPAIMKQRLGLSWCFRKPGSAMDRGWSRHRTRLAAAEDRRSQTRRRAALPMRRPKPMANQGAAAALQNRKRQRHHPAVDDVQAKRWPVIAGLGHDPNTRLGIELLSDRDPRPGHGTRHGKQSDRCLRCFLRVVADFCLAWATRRANHRSLRRTRGVGNIEPALRGRSWYAGTRPHPADALAWMAGDRRRDGSRPLRFSIRDAGADVRPDRAFRHHRHYPHRWLCEYGRLAIDRMG